MSWRTQCSRVWRGLEGQDERQGNLLRACHVSESRWGVVGRRAWWVERLGWVSSGEGHQRYFCYVN